jgi:ABC-2 type transport system ATP-binding protein
LRSAGVTVVLSTHLMDEAESLADLVHIIDGGKLVASGTPAELTSGQIGVLIFRAPAGLPLADLAAVLSAGCRPTETTPGTYLVEGRLGPGELAAVTAWCAGRGVTAEILSTGRRSLEEVFLELTGGAER